MSVKTTDKKIGTIKVKFVKDPDKYTKELKKLLDEGHKKKDPVLIGGVYNELAVICEEKGDYEKFFSHSLRAAAFLEGKEDKERLAIAYINIGYGYALQENSQMSLVYYDKAYQLIKRHRIRSNNRLAVLNNLSTAYHEMEDYKTAIKLVEECLKMVETDTPDDYDSRAMFTINYAQFLKDSGETGKAKEVLFSMDKWLDKVQFDGFICDFYLRQAILEYETGNIKDGGKCIDKALSYIPQGYYPLPIYDDLRQLEYMVVRKKDKRRAGKIAELMEKFADNCKGNMEQFIALRALADYYHNTGDSVKAAEVYIQVDRLYEERMKELKRSQYKVNKVIHEADEEIQRLNRKMQKELKQATKEPLTGLLNRNALLRVAEKYISTARKRKEKVGAIFIDIDFFKECNDTYGHTQGDEIIRRIARICKKEERANVAFARYGGDEFFGLTHGLSDEEVEDIVSQICRSIREEKIPNIKNPNGGIVTVSGGVANVAVTEQIDTIIEIANYADKAVYYAKNSGKDTAYLIDHSSAGTEFRKII